MPIPQDAQQAAPAPIPSAAAAAPDAPDMSGANAADEYMKQQTKKMQQQQAHTTLNLPQLPAKVPMQAPSPAPEGSQRGGQLSTGQAVGTITQNLGGIIHNFAAKHKNAQIDRATGVLSTLSDAWEQAQTISGGDQEKAKQIYSQLPQVRGILDPTVNPKAVKELKELHKLTQYDPFNPEKNTTVYHEAMQRVDKAGKMKKAMSAIQAAIGMAKGQGAPQGAQRAPMDEKMPNGQPAMDVASKLTANTKQSEPDMKGAQDAVRAEADMLTARGNILKAQVEMRDKYQSQVQKDGTVIAWNKSDPNDVIELKTPDGKAVTSVPKTGATPKVVNMENVPYGVARDGMVLTPQSKEWTPHDAEVFQAAVSATAMGEANKAKLAKMRETFFSSLPQAVLMKVDDPAKGTKAGELAFVPRSEAGGNPAMYAPVGAGDKAMGTQARYGEIQVTMDGVNQAIVDLPDTGFDAETRAQLAYVMRSPHPDSAMDTFMKSSAATTLTPAQANYVQWLASLSESAQALVSLQGMGARSSDRMRSAVSAMLPGAATPSKAYAQGQMKKLQAEVDALRKGVPGLGKLGEDVGGASGTINFSDGGTTYAIPKDQVGAFKKDHPNAKAATR